MAQHMMELAERFYPAALLYLGEREEARAAVTEALAAMQRKKLSDALPILMRICWEREIGLIPTPTLFPQDSLLAAVMKLPAEGRRDLGLQCIGISAGDAAEVCDITEEAYTRSLEKAMRQLTFLRGGEAPSAETLRAAVCGISLTDKEKDAVLRGLERAEREYEENQKILAAYKEGRAVRHIVRTRKDAAGKRFSTLDVVLCCVCVVLAAAVAALLLDRYSTRENGTSSGEYLPVVTFSGIRMDAAKEAALKDAGIAAENALFVSSKLELTAEPNVYHLSFRSGDLQYAYKLDAKTGEVLSKKSSAEDALLNAEGFVHVDELRQNALAYTGAKDALLIREKLWQDDDSVSSYCKFDFIDGAGRVYYFEYDAGSMVMTRFDVEWDPAAVTSNVISAEEARRLALSEVTGATAEKVIFTKTKRAGAVYQVAFTLEDGTQHTIELDVQSGSTKKVDVCKVPEDLGETVGLFAARDAALKRAGVELNAVTFTKAKIDTKKGAYVYEFCFETNDTEYEAVLDVKTAEMLKFRTS